MKNKAVMIAIQPYWVFLIIAKKMGWDIGKEKKLEVRKTCPNDKRWNRQTIIYCSKDKKSFNRIPKEYQPLMEKFLGKVVGSFTCDRIDSYIDKHLDDNLYYWDLSVKEWEELKRKSCLTIEQIIDYTGDRITLYGWHISDLKIYGKPRELGEFKQEIVKGAMPKKLIRPPQSWFYVEQGD